MEIRQLRYFLVLAEELHFSRAATRLGVSQPSLSQQVRALEQEFDVVLLERTSRRVKLTAAGAALLDGARTISSALDRTSDVVRDVAAGRSGRLAVGSVSAGFNGILVPVLQRLRVDAPDLRITLRLQPNSQRLLRGVQDGMLDLALLRAAPATPGLTVTTLLEEPFIAYLSCGHRLATEPGWLSLSQLADEPLVMWPRELGPRFYDAIIAGCMRYGFTPRIVSEQNSLEAQLALVATGLGISLQAASNASLTRTDVVVRHLEPEELRCTLEVAHTMARHSAAIDTFLRIAADVVRGGMFRTAPKQDQ